MDALWIGALCGLLVAAPPGPLGALCARNSLCGGRRAGLACGLAIAAGDAVHASVACLLLVEPQAGPGWLRRGIALAAAVVLFTMAWRALRGGAVQELERAPRVGAVFLLALVTPGTLPAFVLLFTTFEVRGSPLAVLGAFGASLVWWASLVGGLALVRERAAHALAWIERATGWLLCLGACGAARVALFG